MKLDSFISFAIKTANSLKLGVKSIRFQVDTSPDMIVAAAIITVDDHIISLPGVSSHDGNYGLDWTVRVAPEKE